jgi:hypothetical protein
MGDCAYTLGCDFRVSAEKVASALSVVCEEFDAEFVTLLDAVQNLTSFEECELDEVDGFTLGSHRDKYVTGTDELLYVLGRFAEEGAYTRFEYGDGSLFGFRVVDGRLRSESGDYVWTLDPEPSPVTTLGAA